MIPQQKQESALSQGLSIVALVVLIIALTPVGFLYSLAQCVFVRGFIAGAAFTIGVMLLYR